jgi:hypothetical protein
MFGYVTPCKMELKVKDYEKFKSYYCGLCHSIKKQYGNLPRMTLNYDMTFLGVLLDSITADETKYKVFTCAVHPFKKKIQVTENDALNYAAFCNVILTYYKLIDNIKDDRSFISKLAYIYLKPSIKKQNDTEFKTIITYVEKSLNKLSELEISSSSGIDQISDAFADLTGYLISTYADNITLQSKEEVKEALYWLGYNLGKWIYIIDAWDDLEKDLKENKYNVLNKLYNSESLCFQDFSKTIEDRVDYLLTACAAQCFDYLMKIPLVKNKELLTNILQFGLMEKMDIVFKRSEIDHAKSL